MANSITIIDEPSQKDIQAFNNAKPKVYYSSTTTRTFTHGESWFLQSGSLDLMGISGNEKYRVEATGIIKFDEGVKVRIYFICKTEVKKIYTDKNYSNAIGTNVKINYMIMETILRLLKKFDKATESQSFIKRSVLKGKKW